jgi:hypothetical protein
MWKDDIKLDFKMTDVDTELMDGTYNEVWGMGCMLTMWNLLVLLPQNKQLYDKQNYILQVKG